LCFPRIFFFPVDVLLLLFRSPDTLLAVDEKHMGGCGGERKESAHKAALSFAEKPIRGARGTIREKNY
jgi:hypothetical protein